MAILQFIPTTTVEKLIDGDYEHRNVTRDAFFVQVTLSGETRVF